MGLTWRDAVSGVIVVTILVGYVAYLQEVRLLLVSSTFAASASILVLGAGCAVIATADLYTRPQPRSGVAIRRITAGIGVLGLAYGLTGMVTGSGYALRNLVMTTVALWATAALWHTFTIGSGR